MTVNDDVKRDSNAPRADRCGRQVFCVLVTGVAAIACGQPSVNVQANEYVIVSLVPPGNAYQAAADELKRIHEGAVVHVAADAIDTLLPKLQAHSPENVAFVVRPEQFDVNLARKVLQLAARVDDDPLVDFSYGFITGRTAKDAVALVKAGQIRQPATLPASAMVGVGGGNFTQSRSQDQRLPIGGGMLRQTSHLLAASDDAAAGKAGAERDDAFIRQVMPKLEGVPILIFAGHGYPDQVVGGPTYEHLKGRKYDGAVALNIACFTGVTHRWYDQDWQTMTRREKQVPADKSFCLNLLSTGLAGYVAYACPRPAGPTMLGDAIRLATAGETLGQWRRRAANSVIMTHLQLGADSLKLQTLADGDPLKPSGDLQPLLTEMSTGGVLFGDPACRPFTESEAVQPSTLTIESDDDRIDAKIQFNGPMWHFFCSDQITRWDDKTQAMRIEVTVPLGDRFAQDVTLVDSALGKDDYRLIAVTEQWKQQRFLHIKASFPTPNRLQLMLLSRSPVFGHFAVTTSDKPSQPKIIRSDSR